LAEFPLVRLDCGPLSRGQVGTPERVEHARTAGRDPFPSRRFADKGKCSPNSHGPRDRDSDRRDEGQRGEDDQQSGSEGQGAEHD
jgi:hypothetical protein